MRSPVAWLVAAVLLANLAVVVDLWLHGGGLTKAHTTADRLTSAGRITGLLAAYSALVQVVLLARIPWFERLTGFDRLTVWHGRNGKACILLLLAHVGLITAGYQQTDQIRLGAEISSLLKDYPHILAATIGTGLMVLVVVTSLVIVRRRVRHEAWYAVHLSVYAGIVLGYLHEVPTGNDLTLPGAAQTYWYVLNAATLALLLAFRVVRPLLRGAVHGLRVTRVVEEAPGVVSIHLTGRRLHRLGAHPGQFFLWRFLDVRRVWQAHPYSLSAAPDGRSLRITVKGTGTFSRRLADLRPGTRVLAEGPLGSFTAARRRAASGKVLLVAGGIGITPLRALLETLDGDVVLVHRVVEAGDTGLEDELAALVAARGATLHVLAGDHRDPDAAHLLSPAHLRELVPDVTDRDVYVCGPPAMADAVTRNLRTLGVRRRHLHTERFAL
ncbi:ferredoxin reductase family protein [Paraconexibacter antarcticus]|uniref:Ferredoxin reductase family protein n=1 Tax=Paraconexibacter antarcticus TaxID=2949664 RepID=A0ABY5DWZ0_9ACTN|nr:ferredoxin reductase family protein [Paraconexibacter antarcticus]UTI66064.1 ferredoxin reductase family protein [Paraconexibacter antarcticus]